MGDERTLGQIVDGLGCELSVDAIEDGDLVACGVVLLKVVTTEGNERLVLARSEGMGWFEHCGIVAAASDQVRFWDQLDRSDDD